MAPATKSVVTAIRTIMASPIPQSSTCPAREAKNLYVRAVIGRRPYSLPREPDSADMMNVAADIESDFLAFGLYMTARIDDIAHKTGQSVWRLERELVELMFRRAAEKTATGLRLTALAMAEKEEEDRRAS